MTVIRPNSVSGITSITAQANEINFFRSNGTLAGLQLNGVNFNTTSGISTLAALKVTGNLDVEGVLTYQDVTNVDSLGIGTFRTGINVSGGQLDVGSNIKLGNAGVITATSFVGSLSGGSVSGTSGAFTGNIDLNSDTNKLKIGAGDDFQFFHNGSNNFIETNNGDIRIKTSDSSGNLTFTAGGSTERLRITSGGQVRIGNENNLALWGQTNRLQVAGTDWNTSGVTIACMSNSGSANLVMGNSRASTPGGSGGALVQDSRLAYISFVGDDGTDMNTVGAAIVAELDSNASSNSMPARLRFYTGGNQSSNERLRITSTGNIGAGGITSPLWTSGGGIHLNDNYGIGFGNGGSGRPDFQLMVTDGSKLEFRCGFGADTADIVMDTSGRLLVGTTTQSISSAELFEVHSDGNGFSHFRNNHSGYAPIYIDNEYTNTAMAPLITITDGGGNRAGLLLDPNSVFDITGQGAVTFSTGGTVGNATEKVRIDSSGRVTKPYTPGFFQRIMDGSTFNSGTMTGGTNQFNTGNHYNTSTGIFTAPIAGRYAVGCGVLVQINSGRLEGNIKLNNSTRIATFNGTGDTYDGPNVHFIIDLSANDNLRVVRQMGTAYPYAHDNHYFYAYLVG